MNTLIEHWMLASYLVCALVSLLFFATSFWRDGRVNWQDLVVAFTWSLVPGINIAPCIFWISIATIDGLGRIDWKRTIWTRKPRSQP